MVSWRPRPYGQSAATAKMYTRARLDKRHGTFGRPDQPNRRIRDPYVRWCGRGGAARRPPIPIADEIMKRLLTFAAILAAIATGCSTPGGFSSEPQNWPLELTQQNQAILDAVVRDILVNPAHKSSRDFYGTPENSDLALVSNDNYGVPWPTAYRPDISGYKFSRIAEGRQSGSRRRRLLGLRIDKFNLEQKTGDIFDYPIEVTILNAGGDPDGVIHIGGCTVYYMPRATNGTWTVEYRGAFDA